MIGLKNRKVALVTGAAGFIGFHISKRLLEEGWRVIGLDCISDYYDVSLKERRESILQECASYISIHEKVDDSEVLMKIFSEEKPNIVVHLAAQAGVRYSIDNPRAYLESNISGTFELLEAARAYPPEHLLLASTSSVYGSNKDMPYKETDRADHQLSFYAATKKSTESIAHSYSHLFELPITMFRFFTVYGPWGRPEMAPFRFARAITTGEPIDIYNHGQMWRDFTYIADLTKAVELLIPVNPLSTKRVLADSKSEIAPFRIVNIGNSNKVPLEDFINAFEKALNKKAIRNYLEMQSGDVIATWSDCSLLHRLTGYSPNTCLETGVAKFCEWYTKDSGYY